MSHHLKYVRLTFLSQKITREKQKLWDFNIEKLISQMNKNRRTKIIIKKKH